MRAALLRSAHTVLPPAPVNDIVHAPSLQADTATAAPENDDDDGDDEGADDGDDGDDADGDKDNEGEEENGSPVEPTKQNKKKNRL